MNRLLKTVVVIAVFLLPTGFKNNGNQIINSIANKKKVNYLDGQPISFYLNHPGIDNAAKSFYKGDLVLSHDLKNCSFIDSVLTSNGQTRPFYFYLFNTIIDLYEGDFNEKLAKNSLLYIEKNPCVFFRTLNGNDVDINVVKWTNFVGIEMSNTQTYQRFKNEMDKKMSACTENSDLWTSFFKEARKCRIK